MPDPLERPITALDRRIPTLPGRASIDPELAHVARGWTAVVRFAGWDVVITDGSVAGVGPAPEPDPRLPRPDIVVRAPAEVWDGLLAADPPPPLQDLWGARRVGLRIEGDLAMAAQYAAALSRIVAVLRPPGAPGPFRSAPARDPRRRFDRAVGRYAHLDLGGVDHRVYFEESGYPEGVPLLLLHGEDGDSRHWRHVLEDDELCGLYRMIAYDVPFHGRSLPPVGVAWWTGAPVLPADRALAVPLALGELLGLDRTVIMGCGRGADDAIRLAQQHPERFRSVVAIGASHPGSGGLFPADATPGPDLAGHPGDPAALAAAIAYGLGSPSAPEPLRREAAFIVAQNKGSQRPAGAMPVSPGAGDPDEVARAHGADRSRRRPHSPGGAPHDLGDTEPCTVHLLTGEYDWATPPSMASQRSTEIFDSSFEVLRGFGHLPMSEDPEAFLDAVRPLLRKLAGG